MPHTDPTRPEFGPPAERSIATGLAEDGTRVTVELGVRALSAAGQPLLDTAVAHLRTARDRGTVADYDIVILGEEFDPYAAVAHTGAGQHIAQRLREIRRWAAREGVSVDPYFHEESVHCRMSDARYARVRFPTLCLTEFHDGDLAFVAPVTVGGRHLDPLDRLRALAEVTPPPDPPFIR